MNCKIFIILIFFIIPGCKLETINKKVNYDNNIYVNKGFTLIYSDELIKDKITKKILVETNKIHKRENSVGYWRILLMPWIIRSLEIFFIRYKQLKNFSDEEYSVSILKDCYQHEFQNSRDFYNFLLNETGQHFSYSLLIEFLRPEKFAISNLPDSENKIRTNHSKKILD